MTLCVYSFRLQEIGEDILEGSVNVTTIDLSNNALLKDLPRYVFSKLKKLNSLILTSCDLRVLYPEHVQTPYDSNSLKNFDGTDNNWQCSQMCEFVTWLQTANTFCSNATMCLCSDSDNYYDGRCVLSLNPDDVCPNSVSKLVQILLGSIFIISILALTITKYCKCKIRCCNDPTSRPSSNACRAVPVREHSNQTYDQSDETPIPHQLTREAIMQSNCDVGDWTINNLEPPSYEVVVGDGAEDTSNDKYNNSDSDSDSPPPPYEEITAV